MSKCKKMVKGKRKRSQGVCRYRLESKIDFTISGPKYSTWRERQQSSISVMSGLWEWWLRFREPVSSNEEFGSVEEVAAKDGSKNKAIKEEEGEHENKKELAEIEELLKVVGERNREMEVVISPEGDYAEVKDLLMVTSRDCGRPDGAEETQLKPEEDSWSEDEEWEKRFNQPKVPKVNFSFQLKSEIGCEMRDLKEHLLPLYEQPPKLHSADAKLAPVYSTVVKQRKTLLRKELGDYEFTNVQKNNTSEPSSKKNHKMSCQSRNSPRISCDKPQSLSSPDISQLAITHIPRPATSPDNPQSEASQEFHQPANTSVIIKVSNNQCVPKAGGWLYMHKPGYKPDRPIDIYNTEIPSIKNNNQANREIPQLVRSFGDLQLVSSEDISQPATSPNTSHLETQHDIPRPASSDALQLDSPKSARRPDALELDFPKSAGKPDAVQLPKPASSPDISEDTNKSLESNPNTEGENPLPTTNSLPPNVPPPDWDEIANKTESTSKGGKIGKMKKWIGVYKPSTIPSRLSKMLSQDYLYHQGQSGFEDLRRYVKTGGDFCKDLSTILQERAEAETQYSKTLVKLSSKLLKATKEGTGSVNTAWQRIAAEMEAQADIHKNFASSLSEDVIRPLKQLVDSQHRIRKSVETAVDKSGKNLAEWRAAESKAKKNSFTCARENEKLRDTGGDPKTRHSSTSLHIQTKPAPEKESTKMESKRRKAEECVKKADVEYYSVCLRAERSRLEWESAVVRGSHCFQVLEEERLRGLKDFASSYLSYFNHIGPKITLISERLSEPIKSCDLNKDLESVISLKAATEPSQEQILPDFYPEHTTLAMNRERRKMALIKLLELIRSDLERERRGKAGVENLAIALKRTPTFASEDSHQNVQDKLHHMRSMLTYLEAARYKVLCVLSELEGKPRPSHPLADHIHVLRDRQGYQQSILKVPTWIHTETEITDWVDRGTADGTSVQPDSDFENENELSKGDSNRNKENSGEGPCTLNKCMHVFGLAGTGTYRPRGEEDVAAVQAHPWPGEVSTTPGRLSSGIRGRWPTPSAISGRTPRFLETETELSISRDSNKDMKNYISEEEFEIELSLFKAEACKDISEVSNEETETELSISRDSNKDMKNYISEQDEFSSQGSDKDYEPVVTISNNGPTKCRALYNYTANLYDELSLNPGDIINIHDKQPDGWWLGELNGVVGIFPATYVEEIK